MGVPSNHPFLHPFWDHPPLWNPHVYGVVCAGKKSSPVA